MTQRPRAASPFVRSTNAFVPVRLRRLSMVTLTVGATIASLLVVAPHAGAAPLMTGAPAGAPSPTGTANATPADSASAQAAATGQPVEVSADTTETNQVLANPDGSFTLNAANEPVRVQRNGAWVPIDTTLTPNPDGSLSPTAAADQVSFSGGGSGPLVTMSAATYSVAFTWPTALPAPVLAGPTATYPSILPGVDLQVTAQTDSFSEVLVVHDATAAANPALSQLRMTATATGVNLSAATDGTLSGTDAAGHQVFHGSQPVMWDSTVNSQVGPAPTATDPGSGKVNALGLSMAAANAASGGSAATAITLTPPRAALTGTGVTYPVYIDPSIAPDRAHFAVVFNNGWHYYDDTSNDLKVGYCGWSDCNGIGTGRTYFNVNIPELGGHATTAHIYTAEVDAYETHNAANCNMEPVQLWSANAFTSSLTWPGSPISDMQEVLSNRGDTCSSAPPGDVVFNNSNVINYFQAAANNDTSVATMALIAHNESDANGWKRFASDGGASGAALQIKVTYVFPPSTPTGLKIDNSFDCGKGVYVHDSTPGLHARANDNNSPVQSVDLYYEYGGTAGGTSPAINAPSSTDKTWSTGTLPDGVYQYRVRAASHVGLSPIQYSAFTSLYNFTIDTTAPDAPTISSLTYPPNFWGLPQGSSTGTFTVHNTSPDTAGYIYDFTSSQAEQKPNDTTCPTTSTATGTVMSSTNTASVPLPSTMSPGPHTVFVEAFDNAHNVSGEASYNFYVSPYISDTGNANVESPTQVEAETMPESQPACQNDPSCSGAGSNPVYQEPGSGPTSNNSQEHLVASAGSIGSPQQFNFTFTPATDGYYALGVRLATANHFGTLQFQLDGTTLQVNGTPVQPDTYSASPGYMYVQLGGANFVHGIAHLLTVNIVGKNAASTNYAYNGTYGTGTTVNLSNYNDNGYSAAIDYFTIVPLNAGTFTTIQSAMNNHGISADNTSSTANIGPWSGLAAISSNLMASAGFGPGATATVDGVAFTMPTYTANSVDNVIADGQTINLPTPGAYQNIDLLVASTCGSAGVSNTIQITTNFSSGNDTNAIMPAVPDWNQAVPANTATETLATTLSYRDVGANATPDTAHPVHLYHVHLPTNILQGDTATSVTLPNYGTPFTNACDGTAPALHVFAISGS